jgi:hypothetical protein
MKTQWKKNIVKTFIYIVLFITIFLFYMTGRINTNKSSDHTQNIPFTKQNNLLENSFEETVNKEPSVPLNLSIPISEQYTTNIGDPSNLYYIDDEHILWGCGRNEYGQLGLGSQDDDFHEDMVKIADHVIHVDYSKRGFVIFLTEDHRLYGLGCDATGALRQLDDFSQEQYINSYNYGVTTPVLLLEDVVYAKCGRDDVAALKTDGSVWIWGTIWYQSDRFNFQKVPTKILDNAVLITGGFFNHAALLADGTVWVWGYNYTGNCGIADVPLISVPLKAAEDVVMVWTGTLKKNTDCFDITEFQGIYQRSLENTIIEKADGSYWICGVNVGNTEKIIPVYYEVVEYPVICTDQFTQIDDLSEVKTNSIGSFY